MVMNILPHTVHRSFIHPDRRLSIRYLPNDEEAERRQLGDVHAIDKRPSE